MRRRSVLAAAGLVAPAQLLMLVDDALAAVPAPTAEPIALLTRLAGARALFDAGRYTVLTGAAAGRWRRMRTVHVTLGTEPHRVRDELPLERPTYIHGGGRDGGWYDLR